MACIRCAYYLFVMEICLQLDTVGCYILHRTICILLADGPFRWIWCGAIRILNGTLCPLSQGVHILMIYMIADNGDRSRHDGEFVQWFEYQCVDRLGLLCRIYRYCSCMDLHGNSTLSFLISAYTKFDFRPSIPSFPLVGSPLVLSAMTTSSSLLHTSGSAFPSPYSSLLCPDISPKR